MAVNVGYEIYRIRTKITEKGSLVEAGYYIDKRDKLWLLIDDKLQPKELLEAIVGLEKDAATRVMGFSKGIKMRLNFCRAFLNNPEIIFLDEPTAGLDPVNAKRIKDIILEKKAEGKTIFLTTHNMHDADELCDRVGFIVEGKLVLIESPRELKIKHGKKIVKLEYLKEGDLVSQEFDLKNLADNKSFLSLLKTGSVQTIHTEEASLEDIFIKATGRHLK